MLLPQPRTDGSRQRATSIGGAALLMVVLYSGLRGTPIPALGSSREVIRQLDPLFVERYSAPPAPEAPEPDAGGDETTEAGTGRANLEQEVGIAIDELARRFGAAGSPAERDPTRGDAASVPGIEAAVEDARFRELFGDADEIASVATPIERPTVTRPAPNARGIAMVTGVPPSPDTAQSLGAGESIPITVEAPTARVGDTPATDVVIKDFEPESLDRSKVDVLADWMEAHPSRLPVGVQVHLNYIESFRTASVPVVTDGREFELYLMFNPSLSELHIMLVEGDRSVYLIDRGFQAQSRSLREGTIRRVNGEIVTVNSRAGAASSNRAREFYNIFLSWWEVAQREAGR